jgi:hypothetical protein
MTVNTVTSDTVFLVKLDKGQHHGKAHNHDDHGVVGINQVVWDPAANTLHAKSDQLLEQDTPYVLVVTDGVRDAAGSPVHPSAGFAELLGGDFDTSQPYLVELSEALDELSQGEGDKEDLSNHNSRPRILSCCPRWPNMGSLPFAFSRWATALVRSAA